MKRRMSGTFWEIAINCLMCGCILQIVCIFLPFPLGALSLGLWIGILLAIAMAGHMDMTIDRCVSGFAEKRAIAYMRVNSVGRYLFVLLAFGLVLVYKIGNPLACFAGVLTLKVAAYTQPFTHKVLTKIKTKG